MSQLKRIATIFVLVCLTLSTGYQPASGHRSQPVEVYHRAWQLVHDNFYDGNFNGKNWADYEHKFDGQIKTNADAQKYLKVMLEALNDPYTRYLDPRAFQDENDAIDARIVGIGINLQQKDQHLIVTRTIEAGPAETAGVRQNDEIVAIDGTSAVGMTPEQAADRIRGKAGSAVQLSVQARATAPVRNISITRQEITIHAVSSKMLDKNIGYISLSTFISNDASHEFRNALNKLSRADGLVVDLRDNPGGLLSNALEIADMLLDGGAIVTTVSRHGRHTDISSSEPVTRQPMVILVDDESASASEILASALKDNGRAIIVGKKTYGKGVVQEINRLPGGSAIHITVSRYLTPSGTDINKVGVIPDVTVDNKDDQMKVALTCLKEKIASSKPAVRTSNLSMIR